MNTMEEKDVIHPEEPREIPRPATPAPEVRRAAWTGSDPRRKSVTLATLLALAPGLGHIYLGYYQIGFIHALIPPVLITMIASDAGELTPLLGIGLAFFWLYNLVDAARRASLYNQALDFAAAGTLPEVEIPSNRGSSVGGIFLMGLGLLFLLYTRFDVDMRWLEEWWPAGIILVGIYLFAKDRRSRA